MILFNGERIALGQPEEVVNDQHVIDLYLGKGDGCHCLLGPERTGEYGAA